MSFELINIRTLPLKPLLHLQQNAAESEKKDQEIARLSDELKAQSEQNTATLASKDQEIVRLKNQVITHSKQYAKDIRDLKNKMQSQSKEHKNEFNKKSTIINLQFIDIQHKENTIERLENTIEILKNQLIVKEKSNGDLRSHIGDLAIELNDLQTLQTRNPSPFFSSQNLSVSNYQHSNNPYNDNSRHSNPYNKSTHHNNPHNNYNGKENLYKDNNITPFSK